MIEICNAVKKIRKKTDSTDPFRICEELGILVMKKSLGTEPDAIKGFFMYKCRMKAIAVNSDLSPEMQRIVVAHEIGHAQLHYKSGLRQYHDFGLFRGGSKAEEDANLFAAELLIRDNDVIEILEEGMSFFDASARLRVPPELLDFKLRIMQEKGYKFSGEIPVHTPGNFLLKKRPDEWI